MCHQHVSQIAKRLECSESKYAEEIHLNEVLIWIGTPIHHDTKFESVGLVGECELLGYKHVDIVGLPQIRFHPSIIETAAVESENGQPNCCGMQMERRILLVRCLASHCFVENGSDAPTSARLFRVQTSSPFDAISIEILGK